MPERRETGRKPGQTSKLPISEQDGERIAKYLARAGVASRRACETLIAEGQVIVDGRKVLSPAMKVTGKEKILVAGEPVNAPEPARLWRYHKPAGLITSNSDPAGRRTIFDELPKSLPRTVTIGRLDLNTEGLLLLTNDGGLARALELPDNDIARTYRARAHGRVAPSKLQALADGLTVDGERFGSISAELERETGTNNWLRVTLSEGRKRVVRRALEAVGLQVNRLIRVSFGAFDLGDLPPGGVQEVNAAELQATLTEMDIQIRDRTTLQRRSKPGSSRRGASKRSPARREAPKSPRKRR